jgi:peptidyl-prolyl cis-trans isomerase SurA
VRRTLLAVSLAAGALTTGAGPARAETVDRIVAVVGNEIILLSEVDEEVYLGRLRNEVDPDDPEALAAYREDVLESKIEEKILVEKARQEGIRVTREEIDEAVDRMVGDIRGRFPDEAAFLAQLDREGMSLADLRRDYRSRVEEQLMVRQVLDRLVRGRVRVEERDVRRYWDEHREEIPGIPAALRLRRILIRPRSSEVDSATVQRAEIVLRRLRSGEDFATLASVFSEGPAASRGGDLGWFRPADLEPRLAEAVAGLQPGGLSDVVITGRGAHILKVEEQRGDELRLRQIVFLRDETAARAAARVRAEDALRRIAAGESFAAVATEVSDDEETRERGGDLGAVPLEGIGPELRPKLDPLAPGESSGILEDREGLSIYLVEGREGERPAAFDDVRDRIELLLQQKQTREMYEQILDEARARTFVENRLQPGS